MLFRSDSDDEEETPNGSAAVFPTRPMFQMGRSFEENIAQFTGPRKLQTDNLVNTLHVLMHHGYYRPLIVIERFRYQASSASVDTFLNVDSIQRVTGYNVQRVDTRLTGKGSSFTAMKKQFDNPQNPPIALMCFGIDPSFMVGTDLAHADALVVVGEISSDLITQALGRTFRPLAGRDNTRSIKVVKVYSGNHALRRRGRPQDFDDED